MLRDSYIFAAVIVSQNNSYHILDQHGIPSTTRRSPSATRSSWRWFLVFCLILLVASIHHDDHALQRLHLLLIDQDLNRWKKFFLEGFYPCSECSRRLLRRIRTRRSRWDPSEMFRFWAQAAFLRGKFSSPFTKWHDSKISEICSREINANFSI
jgi:hypothetical protein